MKLNIEQAFIWLAAAFVIVTGGAPGTTRSQRGDFLGAAGRWLAGIVNQSATSLPNPKR